MALTNASTTEDHINETNQVRFELESLKNQVGRLIGDITEMQRATTLDLNNIKQTIQNNPNGNSGGLRTKAAEKHMPEKWANEKGQIPFAEFQFKLENWLAALDPSCDPPTVLGWAANHRDPITAQEVAGQGANAAAIDRELYMTLVTCTAGSPAKLVRKAGSANGFAAWQLIAANCRPRSVIDGATAMAQIQTQTRTKNLAEFRAKLDVWDLQVADYESRYTEKISENSKVASVLMMMPEDLYLRKFEGETGRTYLEMRRIIADIMAASPQIGRGHAPWTLVMSAMVTRQHMRVARQSQAMIRPAWKRGP